MKTRTEVIIIGGGPVGLSMAIGLARQGIESILIEKHPSTTKHPKARGVNIRSMEIFQKWGVDEALRQYQLPEEAHRFTWLESFQTKELARVSVEEPHPNTSPSYAGAISQDWVEEELAKATEAYPEISCYFNTKMLHFEQTDDAVTIRVEDRSNQQQQTITGQYLVAADGASSPIREALNVNMLGRDNLGEFCNIFCEMDLSQWVKNRPSVGFMFTRPDILGAVMLAKDGFKQWLVGLRYDMTPGLSKESFSDEFCIEAVKKIISDPSIEVKLINKAFWTMAALIAEHFRIGRIFLAGDAAHRLPPSGGMGMNTGVQDAHNLAWKLSMVIKGYAKDTLLDSYGEERAPTALMNIQWSEKNAVRFVTIFEALYEGDEAKAKAALAEQHQHLNKLGIDLGFCYEKGALITEDANPPTLDPNEYTPSTYPGCRAPHYELMKQGELVSTLSLFETEFVLLSSDQNAAWHEAAKSLASNLPLRSYQIGDNAELQDPKDDFFSTYEITHQGAILVRPDGHVAWRAKDAVSDEKITLEKVFATILS